MIYTYDGTFFGFLSAVFDGWHDGLSHVEDIHPLVSTSLFAETNVPTDEGKAKRILDALKDKCGPKCCHFLYYGFLAEVPKRELPLVSYIWLSFRYKEQFYYHLHEAALWKVRQWAQKTGNERHKLLGLIRFQELSDGMLYSRINPTCHVVPVMAPHFVKRLPKERWVIHDVRRHMGVYYDGSDVSLVEIPKTLSTIDVSTDEARFNNLWKGYYDTIAIAERRNEGLRRQFMPKKYWHYIIELKDRKNY